MSKSFKDLKVWQDAKQLAVEIYNVTNDDTFNKNYSLRDQIQRSVVSVASNIAEGCERDSDKEFVRFLNIAKKPGALVRSIKRTF
ncbi:four helix bundle protein [Lutispora thermophila]|uniref:Four helix bundle protein n=1 Tax=Lutispora thermophila DSM 19022 TaxID=1122184 RepID=A0A1M6BWJ1_9FIRM|nr:four helix bundle protein [Lutispora thermophila]SHI53003.1 four helix bundle protein [Lutispora thermophila DSM 19022]